MNKLNFLIVILIFFSCGRDRKFTYYQNGNIKQEESLRKGKYDGEIKGYFEDGEIKFNENWKDGKLDGISRHFYPTGIIKEETQWKNGQKVGTSKTYYENGTLWSLANFTDNKKSSVVLFYENGNILERQLYDANERLIYFAKLDSSGFKYMETLIPIFTPEKDTIKLSDLYKVTIHFGLPLKGDLKAYTGESKEGTSKFIDPVELEEISPYVFQYIYKPEKAGSYSIPFKFEHETDESDTLNVGGLNVKHGIHVVDDSV